MVTVQTLRPGVVLDLEARYHIRTLAGLTRAARARRRAARARTPAHRFARGQAVAARLPKNEVEQVLRVQGSERTGDIMVFGIGGKSRGSRPVLRDGRHARSRQDDQGRPEDNQAGAGFIVREHSRGWPGG